MAESTDFTPIVVFHSNTAAALPTVSNLLPGEIAVNVADRKIYTRDDNDNIVELSGGNDHTHVAGDITDFTTEVTEIVAGSLRPNIYEIDLTAFTPTLTYESGVLRFSSNSAVTVTLPTHVSDPLPIGYIIHLHQKGSGKITVVGATGVSVNAAESLSTRTTHSSLSCIKVANDAWDVIGDQELVT